jgi:hypothetical protein
MYVVWGCGFDKDTWDDIGKQDSAFRDVGPNKVESSSQKDDI